MQTSYTQKTERNLNLYKSNGSFEGFAEGTEIVRWDTRKSKNSEKNPRPQWEIIFSYAGKLFTVICTKDLFVKHILDKKTDWNTNEKFQFS